MEENEGSHDIFSVEMARVLHMVPIFNFLKEGTKFDQNIFFCQICFVKIKMVRKQVSHDIFTYKNL